MQGHSKRNGSQQQTGEFGVPADSKAAYGLADDNLRSVEADDVEDDGHDRAQQMLGSSYVERQ